MRLVHLTAAALLVLPLAACSSGGGTVAAGSSSGAATSASSSPSSTDSSPGPTTEGSDTSNPSCGDLTKEELTKYLVYTQLLAQVRDQSSLDALKDSAMTDYTPAKLDAILAKMAGLSADAADAVAYFQKADALVAAMLAGKPTAADFQNYQQAIGGVPGMLQRQLTLNQVVGTTCPKLR